MIISPNKGNIVSISSYEIKISDSNHNIPILNGIHLHSLLDPLKESTELLKKHLSLLKRNNNLIILGLGFGYHVKKAMELLKEFHGEDYKIVIIEPNYSIIEDCQKYNPIDDNRVMIFNKHVAELYTDKLVLDHLYKKPLIIIHPPSYNVYQKYYKEYLSYSAPKDLKSIYRLVEDNEVRQYLSNYAMAIDGDLNSFLEYVKGKDKITNQYDFIMMAYEQIN
ncbi:MAG: hypothetical protein HQK49_08430 [Oligoflexia bacterium]|nr:hypothetical protein [Oligoflexia bacterium]